MRFTAALHFHVCVIDGVFEEVAGDAAANATARPPCVIFHPASGLDEAAVAQVQASLRRRMLRVFVGRGLIERCDAKEMLTYQHSGFSVDAGVCIRAHNLWAVLIARIYEVFPLLCPMCGGQMRLIAFITEGARPAT